jgi:hypothetical protein
MYAHRDWGTRLFWVAQVKGDGGKDWGYTTEFAKAIVLNVYWQRRFNADCRRVGAVATFIPAK